MIITQHIHNNMECMRFELFTEKFECKILGFSVFLHFKLSFWGEERCWLVQTDHMTEFYTTWYNAMSILVNRKAAFNNNNKM